MTAVPIPQRMKGLPLDQRGIPIPWNVVIDRNGLAHFAIQNQERRDLALAKKLCPICGQKLANRKWLVGGPRSALHPQGAYIDTPMHDECAHYALRVCPYIAAPVYAREIGPIKAAQNADALAGVLIRTDPAQPPSRPPADMFVAVETTGFTLTPARRYVRPNRPYKQIEFWRHGQQLDEKQAMADILQSDPELESVLKNELDY